MTDISALTIRRARAGDVDTLAALNEQLLVDENNRRSIPRASLRQRHADWLRTRAWSQDLFEITGEPVGYIVHAPSLEPSDPDRTDIYIRQFCVDRRHRRGGVGQAAIALFLAERVVPGERVILDVLEANPAGRSFWRAAGFAPFMTRMELFR
jgi:GNAT superfamily N-acetyltransferase